MKEYIEIVDVLSREIYDSNGVPTVETEVVLDDGTVGRASVGSNYMSTEHYSELRDGDLTRLNGMGVSLAVTNVNTEIAEALLGLNALEQAYIDKVLLEIDGTNNCRRLGANAVLSASLAVAKAASYSIGMSLYSYLGGICARHMPIPVVSGIGSAEGLYAVPATASSFPEALQLCRRLSSKNTDYNPEDVTFVEKPDIPVVNVCTEPTVTKLMDKIFDLKNSVKFYVLATMAGETEDTFLADLAIAGSATYVFTGNFRDSVSTTKFNRLLRIYEELAEVTEF